MKLEEVGVFADRILVRPDPKEAVSEGGLHIPETVLADNPNYFYVSGVVLKLGDGYREDVYECLNHQCRYQTRRTVGEYCPVCKATQNLAYADSGVHAFGVRVGDRVLFGRFAGKQIEVTERWMFSQKTRLASGGMWKERYGDFTEPFMSAYDFDRRGWMDETNRREGDHTYKALLMREVEVLGILTGDARVTPGYEAAKWSKTSKGLTPDVTQVIR